MSGIDGKSTNGQLSDFLAIASVLADPTKVADEYKKLDEARQKAQEVIKLVGPAKEILAMREEIERLKNSAQTKLDDAETFGKKLKADAQKEAADIVAAAQKKAAEIVDIADKKMDEALSIQKDAEDMISSAKTREKAADDMISSMKSKYEALSKDALTAQLEAKKAEESAMSITSTLRDAASQLVAVLDEIAKD